MIKIVKEILNTVFFPSLNITNNFCDMKPMLSRQQSKKTINVIGSRCRSPNPIKQFQYFKNKISICA